MEVDTEQESSGQADRRKPRDGSKRLLEPGAGMQDRRYRAVEGQTYSADSTTIAISVNDRSERDITKHFKELQIDWPVAERQLQSWSHLLRIGKTLEKQPAPLDGGLLLLSWPRGMFGSMRSRWPLVRRTPGGMYTLSLDA
ncbi:hypothetical protein B0T26DRAFT_267524 [Lasiosphaeria miniovina]|uniref:Uncharacterized protein n=1 Tax=Lasiosphaeria miniovina TaxID=1954250 RepID=A0AA40AJ37_9PEZI|nr:uncharacterized protein B0T26DRAFT_267524 [Lasiosphaeria miniovina]KAK0716806.1 hypothetical protein B0T26DRAFT_267524 [Lasiosphaeria miniovina]